MFSLVCYDLWRRKLMKENVDALLQVILSLINVAFTFLLLVAVSQI